MVYQGKSFLVRFLLARLTLRFACATTQHPAISFSTLLIGLQGRGTRGPSRSRNRAPSLDFGLSLASHRAPRSRRRVRRDARRRAPLALLQLHFTSLHIGPSGQTPPRPSASALPAAEIEDVDAARVEQHEPAPAARAQQRVAVHTRARTVDWSRAVPCLVLGWSLCVDTPPSGGSA